MSSVFNPLLLNEFELAEQAGIQSHKDNAVFVFIANRLTLRHVSSVSQPAAHDAPAVDQLAVESKCVTRISAPDVGANRTAQAVQILAVSEIRVAIVVGDQRRIHAIR